MNSASLPSSIHNYNSNSHSNSKSKSSNIPSSSIPTLSTHEMMICNYNLYHPRNLSAQVIPKVKILQNQHNGGSNSNGTSNGQSMKTPGLEEQQNPHSAGCRMSSISCPTWTTVPQSNIQLQQPQHSHQSLSDKNPEIIVKCTTVIHTKPKSNYIAMGDTAGYVTLYSKLPFIRPISVLHTSSSARYNLNKLNQNSSSSNSSSSHTKSRNNENDTSTSKKPKRIGVTNNVLMSTIDRNFAIECIGISGGDDQSDSGVLVGTRFEVEYISFDDKIQWSMGVFNICKDADSNNNLTNSNGNDSETSEDDERIIGSDGGIIDEGNSGGKGKVMKTFVPKRFDIDNGGILASFELYHMIDHKEKVEEQESKKEEKDTLSSSAKTKTTSNENKETEPDDDNENDNNKDEKKQKQQQFNDTASRNGHLVSPMWHIDTKSGKAKNLIPKEYVNSKFQNVIIGHKAMAIWDKSIPYANNILAVCTTQDATTKEIQQELLLLNNSQQIIFRANLPTRTSGSKVITCEAINQSQRGAFTIAATSARGAIRLFKTDGLVHLGTYGEGVSLHGHSIFWQDCFFIEMGNLNNDYASKDDLSKRKSDKSAGDNDDECDSSCDQEQWGQIFERKDELKHRGACKNEEIERIKSAEEESLKGLHIVSVPHAFREPVEMKETIHFWDTTTCELDGGNCLPSFTLSALKRSGGIINFLHDKSFPTSHGSRFLLSTYGGECVQLAPTMTSDWSGQMYPAGYRVIDNNLIYIEDEDELDKVIDGPIDSDGFCKAIDDSWGEVDKSKPDTDLEKALLISRVDETVDVINDDTEDVEDFFISDESDSKKNHTVLLPPCRPEPRLKHELNETKDNKDDVSNSFGSLEEDSSSRCEAVDILRFFPQQSIVENLLKSEEEKSKKRQDVIGAKLAISNEANKEKTPKPRTRVANIEAMINSSVDKHLTVSMIERENFSGKSGSMFMKKIQVEGTDNLESKLKAICAACRGRKVLHSCGKRVKPIDYDAIEKARKEKQEEERKAKLEAQAKKRREADAKRREVKKKQKEEEKRAKLEEERIEKEMVERARNALIEAESSYHQENFEEEERKEEVSEGEEEEEEEEEERIEKEMAEQARNALVDTQSSYQENLEEEERIKKEMAEQARNALTDTHSSFHETVDPHPLHLNSNNENQSVTSQSMVSTHDYQLAAESSTPTNHYNRPQQSAFNAKNEDCRNAPKFDFNEFSPLQQHSNLDDGGPSYELETNHRRHYNDHSSESVSPLPQKYQGLKTESNPSHEMYQYNKPNGSSYYSNQQYHTQHSENKYPVSGSNHDHNFHNQYSYMPNPYPDHNNHREVPTHHNNQQNYQTQHNFHQQQQHHPQPQQHYSSHNEARGYESNVYYNAERGDSVAKYESKHQTYSYNDDTHHFGENNGSNMNGSYFQETQQKPYYSYSNTPVFSRKISTAKSNGEYSTNNNVHPN